MDLRIIVPYYAWPDLLDECLASISDQDYPVFDVMVVMDIQESLANLEVVRRISQAAQRGASRGDRRWLWTTTGHRGGELHSVCVGTRWLVKNGSVPGAMVAPITDQTVIAHVCGDDVLLPGALGVLAEVYADPDVWMTYGQYRVIPSGCGGHCREYPPEVVEAGRYREYGWYASHLRSYRYGLWRRIPPQQLLDPATGETWFYATDRAMMYPMLEMAGKHARFIPQQVYGYRRHPGNVHPSLDTGHAQRVDAMDRLEPIDTIYGGKA